MPKLLIVDDEPATVDMISTFLSINQYETVGAYSGTEGLSKVELEAPDMLILDLMMPDMEGFDVCRNLRANNSHADIPIVIVSARTDPEAIDKALACGANKYMTKPLDLSELLALVKEFVG